MARVRPFHGIRYTVPDLGPVVSPPYDVIPEEALAAYRERSPYNVVRLIRPGTDYDGAAGLEKAWLGSGVLREDAAPAFYLHEQHFDGRRRRGLIAAVRLSPYGAGEVLPHERTHGGAKADRLELYRATATAFEPLWFVYRGNGTDLPGLLDAGFGARPDTTFRTDDGGEHRLWIAAETAWQEEVTRAFAGLPLLIADGHHRYETALTYAAEVGASGEAAANHAMVLLVDIDDPGLVVLPTHRVMRVAPVAVVGGEPAGSLAEMLAALRGHRRRRPLRGRPVPGPAPGGRARPHRAAPAADRQPARQAERRGGAPLHPRPRGSRPLGRRRQGPAGLLSRLARPGGCFEAGPRGESPTPEEHFLPPQTAKRDGLPRTEPRGPLN